ncbi:MULTISPECIES: anaerobic C4-dicarboxylate transporter family protein [Apibacter]|uniref:anaerobic C4-dicarboxylate transporter family protein n=1 Tax=Apibacter TaxID=1778601 RepID=UPI00132533DA|nr:MULTISPECIES: anaerobic C4-dicarboxylate transporter [Apibacter]MCX8677578.1 anaerobic C4-dicarboxylate transporter [Apibacter sp. B3919]MXO24218.1 anaerobic C4-dicarboxylate transporter [Apibacter sp. B3924]MXO27007.1 anaerobic C4-dicarboxylate transporter [Apibacter sp. B3813]MXO28866.1 anaerobic C4-dicarboxylate transporter [Apibacter sp. B3913]MXO30817.1 anaerobic C4-dicarboxylate transporter [Apibacter sp. B3912]
MILLEFMVVMAAIFIGARKGGLGLGIFGGLGLAVLVFVFKLKPQNPPIDVMLMIVAVITAASTLQASGGIDYMVNIAEKLLRAYPPAITIVAPIVSYIFTMIAGTGHIAYALLPIISEVATDAKVRPERPLSISVIASQQAITASPISAATAALLSVIMVKNPELRLTDILMISVPSTLIGVIVAAIVQMFIGVDLEKDPEYQKRINEGLLEIKEKSSKNKVSFGAKLSVIIFLVSVVGIVVFGSIDGMKPTFNGVPMAMPHIIEILMLAAAGCILLFTKTNVEKIATGSIFSAGMQAVIAIFGIAWMGDTFFGGNLDFFKGLLTTMVTEYPWTFAIALFIMSIMLFSQAATVRALMPLGVSLGIPIPSLIAMFPAVNGYFFIPNYPTIIAAINFDRTGTTRIGKYVVNHSFQLPGFIATIVAVSVGFGLAYLLF